MPESGNKKIIYVLTLCLAILLLAVFFIYKFYKTPKQTAQPSTGAPATSDVQQTLNVLNNASPRKFEDIKTKTGIKLSALPPVLSGLASKYGNNYYQTVYVTGKTGFLVDGVSGDSLKDVYNSIRINFLDQKLTMLEGLRANLAGLLIAESPDFLIRAAVQSVNNQTEINIQAQKK